MHAGCSRCDCDLREAEDAARRDVEWDCHGGTVPVPRRLELRSLPQPTRLARDGGRAEHSLDFPSPHSSRLSHAGPPETLPGLRRCRFCSDGRPRCTQRVPHADRRGARKGGAPLYRTDVSCVAQTLPPPRVCVASLALPLWRRTSPHSPLPLGPPKAVALAHEPALDPNAFKAFKLQKVEKVTHNTNLYRCAHTPGCSVAPPHRRIAAPRAHRSAQPPPAPNAASPSRTPTRLRASPWRPASSSSERSCAAAPVPQILRTGSSEPTTHLSRPPRAPIGEGGKAVIRPYTPVSTADAKSHLDLVVKAPAPTRTHPAPHASPSGAAPRARALRRHSPPGRRSETARAV